MEHRFDCPICHQRGMVAHLGLKDVRYGVAGSFDIRHCASCDFFWTDPWPAPDELKEFYREFYQGSPAHVFLESYLAPREKRLLGVFRDFLRKIILCGYYGYRMVHDDHRYCAVGKTLGLVPLIRFKASWDLGELLPPAPSGLAPSFLDVGSGEGGLLELMRYLGWNVWGVEPHPDGAAAARKKGLRVSEEPFEDVVIQEKSLDVIVMNHVLEHMRDPHFVIEKCWKALRKGGRLALRVPNAGSLGARLFGRDSYSWDTPRHLNHFSVKSLKLVFKDFPFETLKVATLPRAARTIYDHSRVVARSGRTDPSGVRPQWGRGIFAARESVLCLFGVPVGEEIELVAIR